MTGMADYERLAPVGVDCRWWLTVFVLLVGAGAFLLLPSLMVSTTLALPMAGVSIAVALAVWLRQGSWHRRVSAGLFALSGIVLLIVSLSQPFKESEATASMWRTATACMLMGFALMVGLLTLLENRARRDKQPAAAPSEPPAGLAPAAVMAAAPPVDQTADDVATVAVPVSAAPQMDPETLDRVLAHCKVMLARTGGGMLWPDMVIDRLRESVRAALNRVLAGAHAGDAAAQAAIDQAKQSADLKGVRWVLAQVLDLQTEDLESQSADRVELARGLAAISLLSGERDEAHRRLREALAIAPRDLRVLDCLALAAELRSEPGEAEEWYCRLLMYADDPALKASAHGSLGLIYQAQDELDKAEQMHLAARTISEQLGKWEDVANQLGHLGAVQEMRGQVDLAESMYRHALEIHERLGKLEGMASQYVNLGLLASQRDDVPAARQLWGSARDLFARAGLTGNARLVQQFLDELVAP